MKLKIRKLLFALSENARRKTKELAKITKSSQQSCSYLVNQYRKKNYIQDFVVVVDPIKLGFINILVGYDFLSMEYSKKREIIKELSSSANVVSIEENQLGVDILAEYSVLNLSAFNKLHSGFIKKFQGEIIAKFIFPIIVKHRFHKNYLVRKGNFADLILCGDREPIDLKENEKGIISGLVERPDINISRLALEKGMSAKTAIKLKQGLEKKGVIRGYSCILNNTKFDINRYHVLLRFSNEGVGFIESFVQYSRLNKNIVSLTKLLGHFQVMITVEEFKNSDIIKQIRSEFPTDDYLVLKSDKIIKEKTLPLEDWLKN